MELGENYFGVMDYILLLLTLLVSLLIGLYYGYVSKHTNEELLVGGRNLSVIPVASSIMVTYLSAITIIGFPSEVYAFGAQIYVYHLVAAVGISTSALLIMPFFYEMKLISINEYLERRFDVSCRYLAAVILMVQQILLSGVILYAPSIALEKFLGFPMWISILGTGICATIYTNIGGLKAVVLTDAFQCIMMIGGMLVIVWKGFSASGGLVSSLEIASERGRMSFLDLEFNPFSRHNLWNFIIGIGLHGLMQPSVHQLQVQRYSSMNSSRRAKLAILGAVPLKLLIISLCLVTGFAIFSFYANCDPLSDGKIKKVDEIVPYFVVHELTDIPGMMGIFSSCIFSAVLSSISSSLNSLAAVTWEDFLSRLNYFKAMSPKGQTNVSRVVGAIFGCLFIALAFAAKHFGNIYQASTVVIGSCAGALYGGFLMGLFLPFVNAAGAFCGMISGFLAMIIISMVAFLDTTKSAMLPLSTESCVGNLTSSISLTDVKTSSSTSSIPFDQWPWKIFRLSYLLYPFVGAMITILVGISVSKIVAYFIPAYRKRPKLTLIHPLVRSLCRNHAAPETVEFTLHKEQNGGTQSAPKLN